MRRPIENPLPYIVVAFFGFFVNVTTIGVIRTCGSLTFKGAEQVRNTMVIMLSSWLYKEKQTIVQLSVTLFRLLDFSFANSEIGGKFRHDHEERGVYGW